MATPRCAWRGRGRRWRGGAGRLPATAPRVAIEEAIARDGRRDRPDAPDRFAGIGLGRGHVVGTAVLASALADLLAGVPLPEAPVLVVDTLEPSWAVVFPRFSAVVADLGGALSHASILLREAGIPAVVNAGAPTGRSPTATSSASTRPGGRSASRPAASRRPPRPHPARRPPDQANPLVRPTAPPVTADPAHPAFFRRTRCEISPIPRRFTATSRDSRGKRLYS